MNDSLLSPLIDLLRSHGYTVTRGPAPAQPGPPLKWETPKAFCARVGIHGGTLIKLLANPHCPKIPLDRARGGKGRLRFLSSNRAFERFVCRGRQAEIGRAEQENRSKLVPAPKPYQDSGGGRK